MATRIHAFGPNGELSPGAAAALAGLGGGGGDTTVQIGTVTLPESPTVGLSVSVLADSDTVLPEDVTWDSGGEPTITERMLLVFVWSGDDWVGTYGPSIPAAPVSPDTTGPTAGTLGVVPGVTTADLTVTGASDDIALHATPYAFSTNNGSTWSAYQAGATYEATGLTADTSYTFRHRVRDAAGNVTVGTAVVASTEPAPTDTTPPSPGTLAASAITSSGFTLTVTGASDNEALHGTPYRFSTDSGATYSAWQAGATFNATGLDPETEYTCVHQVRDAALNVATGTAQTVTTTAGAGSSAYVHDMTTLAGLTPRWDGGAATITVEQDATALNGTRIQLTISASSQRCGVSIDALDNAPADVEILARVKASSTATGSWCAPFARGSGATNAVATLTAAAYRPQGTGVTGIYYNNGSFTDAGVSVAVAISPSTDWFWIRVKTSGSSKQYKAWMHGSTEPEQWNSSSSGPSAAGWVGIFGTTVGSHSFDWLSVSTDGTSAPGPA